MFLTFLFEERFVHSLVRGNNSNMCVPIRFRYFLILREFEKWCWWVIFYEACKLKKLHCKFVSCSKIFKKKTKSWIDYWQHVYLIQFKFDVYVAKIVKCDLATRRWQSFRNFEELLTLSWVNTLRASCLRLVSILNKKN